MTKIRVDGIKARGLSRDNELKSLNGAYLQLSIGNSLTGQRQKTKPQPGLGASIAFGEIFEFDANETDDLEVKLCEDEFLWDKKLGDARIPLRTVVQTDKRICAWFPLSEKGEVRKNGGEVFLSITTADAH
ncbi:hypothetical protein CONCODRAFT_70278 [Conidiobolus coronatus NRRL 28638]|uniref:C2 domain-containing protein n=1 Tax=Conidiobolus coronatus (strain ATCC 28846 / CBS 209.66 / NRRL 28638) TaxID=796925 RepID=A0A137P7A5_CONC2|nr:hypothetical protein CONCODRAFT_70278 [Conidiobolus coronatus NRRL 28638]|eukprot:KXN70875.1 hypothetical protein CONCODRAFT_70278 [Conidiobolus coronatus NRRL 28638]